ncbi:MAG TPA: SagB/ThcOx family dehydrogenase [Gaiellaceae bacterium]|nr:SagB/ThcOx family dehydrogenase [Gaiellaceae bacterium]
MRPAVPTAHFASLVYGEAGVPLDDPAEAFHESSRIYPSLEAPRPEVLLELIENADLHQTIDRAARTHDHRPGIDLPSPAPLRGRLGDLLVRRRSSCADVPRPASLRDLGAVLGAAYAVKDGRGGTDRPIPSAGALYPLEVYVVSLAVNDLDRGIYHYHPFRHRLSRLAPLPWPDLRAAMVDPGVLDHAASLLIVTAVFWRSRFKYGARGYRFALLEAGHLVQNAVLAATDVGMPTLPLGGFFDRRLDALVHADGLDEATVHALVLGGSA